MVIRVTTKRRLPGLLIHDSPREADLARWVEADKLVLTVDYSRVPDHVVDSFTRGRANGYVPYVSDRGLSRLFIYEGFEPD